MKHLTYLLLSWLLMACNGTTEKTRLEHAEDIVSKLEEPIVGERIDGPANVRNAPNGDVIFELNDDALVEMGKTPKNGWYEVMVFADIPIHMAQKEVMPKDWPIVVEKDTIGRVIKSQEVSIQRGNDYALAHLYGYTHVQNIKSETVLETAFQTQVAQKGRNLKNWSDFIYSFQMNPDAFGYKGLTTFFTYESVIEDPSPGFRMVLLYEEETLVGILHTRKMEIPQTQIHDVNPTYQVTFFNDYPPQEQTAFVAYMRQWLKGVD